MLLKTFLKTYLNYQFCKGIFRLEFSNLWVCDKTYSNCYIFSYFFFFFPWQTVLKNLLIIILTYEINYKSMYICIGLIIEISLIKKIFYYFYKIQIFCLQNYILQLMILLILAPNLRYLLVSCVIVINNELEFT